jgi:fumarate reductase iron-sulfur subunit
MGRELTFKILKYDPRQPEIKATFEEFKLEELPGMTLFIALNKIREELDSSLAFDFVCRAGICGSCGMVVNGKPQLACRALTKNFSQSDTITITPMPGFELIKDLSVDTGVWMEEMTKRVESWVHTDEVTDISKIEKPVEPQLADDIFELDRCIECGLCVTSCMTKLMRPDFVGAVGLNRVARFYMDPHDKRDADDMYELVGDDNGVFGCMSLMGCEDHCPKDIPLQGKIAHVRRELVKAGKKR